MNSIIENTRPSQQVRELSTIVPGATTDELLHKLLSLGNMLRNVKVEDIDFDVYKEDAAVT